MGILGDLGTGQGHLKAGFLGFPKSGKTFTAALLAIGLKKHFDLKGPIAMFDTESGSQYIEPMIKAAFGQPFLGARSRSFSDLMSCAQECIKQKVSILIVDSITHPWRELCEAHLASVNKRLKDRNIAPRLRLEFQDWNVIKPVWSKWTDFFLNSKIHIIICGRAGYEWDWTEPDEESGKRELIKSGVKMKTETEFGFEPSLLVEMERINNPVKKPAYLHHATIIGDRFNAMDGMETDNPQFEFWLPHINLLSTNAYSPVDTELKTDTGVNEEGLSPAGEKGIQRAILLEKIQAELDRLYPGRTAESLSSRAETVKEVFGTTSKTEIEKRLPQDKLAEGLVNLKGRP